jgi:hypothetical protein
VDAFYTRFNLSRVPYDLRQADGPIDPRALQVLYDDLLPADRKGVLRPCLCSYAYYVFQDDFLVGEFSRKFHQPHSVHEVHAMLSGVS